MSHCEFPFEKMRYDYPKHKYYAVRVGLKKGVYVKWEHCLKQIEGIPNADWKGFEIEDNAKEYVDPFCYVYEGQLTLHEFFKKKKEKINIF